jgi:cyclase
MQRALAVIAAAAAFVAAPALAQQPPNFADVAVRTTDLGKRTYMLEGMGGNVTVAVADDGIIMVDSQFAPMHDKLKAAIAQLSPRPIKVLVNTHVHGDHVGGNEAFAKDGATVTAHENLKTRLAAGTTNGLTGQKTPPAPTSALPTKTYRNWFTLRLKGRSADVKHYPKAHTDGDTYVYFKDANVLATGDIVSLGRYPNIDFANGGHIDGMIGAVDIYVKLANDQTKVVPGHGALTDKKGLIAYRALLVEARSRVAKLIKDGKSEADAVAAKPFADLDAKVNANETASGNFVRVIYNSLKPKPAA